MLAQIKLSARQKALRVAWRAGRAWARVRPTLAGFAAAGCVSVGVAFILGWPFGLLVAGAFLLAIDLRG